MTWEPVMLVSKFKGYTVEVYKRMDDVGWGVRIMKGNHTSTALGERRIDGMTQLRAKRLGKKLVLKHRRLSK